MNVSLGSVRITRNEGNAPFLSDGKIALGVVIGLVLSTFCYLYLSAISSGQMMLSALGIVIAFASVVVASGSMLVAARALSEQRKSREAATDPVLIAHFSQREDARELITFRISNVGAGAALNVTLAVNKPEDDLAQSKRRLNLTLSC